MSLINLRHGISSGNHGIGRRFQVGAMWNLIGAVLSHASNSLTNLLIANLLGREVFGEFGIVQSTAMTVCGNRNGGDRNHGGKICRVTAGAIVSSAGARLRSFNCLNYVLPGHTHRSVALGVLHDKPIPKIVQIGAELTPSSELVP